MLNKILQNFKKYTKIPKYPKFPKNPKIQKIPLKEYICLSDDLRVETVPLEDGVEPGEAVQQVVQGGLQYTNTTYSVPKTTWWKNSVIRIRIILEIWNLVRQCSR